MNTIQKNNLAQEISLYLFAKYKTDDLLKKMSQYNISLPRETNLKRQYLTSILKQSDEHILKSIQKKEKITTSILQSAIPETPQSIGDNISDQPRKIFISHSKNDSLYVQEIIHILEIIGIESNKIFCSSYEGYGNPLGVNYLDALKEELQGNTMVLFVLSRHFFSSNICLCEMGAAWILTQDQIPLYIPPFTPEEANGVFPTRQGMFINRKGQLILLKEQLEEEFKIQKRISFIRWEQQIDKFLKTINESLKHSLT